jgi:chromosome segregation ATPase
MNQDIHTHLEKLKVELNKLEPAVKHLQKADENATALITSLTNIHKEFSKHLQSIEKSLSDANEKHQKQLTKEIQDSTKKITDATEQLSKSNSAFEKQIKAVLSGYSELAEAASRLIKKIDSVDFPSRFDKLDATVSSINQGLQNTQQRLGDIERNIKDDLLSKQKELTSKIESAENATKQRIDNSEKEFTKMFEKVSKENNLLKILLFVSIGLALGAILFRAITGQ